MSVSGSAVEPAVAPAKVDPILNRKSLEFGFRTRRFARAQRYIEDILAERGSCDIVDLGGTEIYWSIAEDFLHRNRSRIRITLVNLELEPVGKTGMFTPLVGDAADPGLFGGRRFDLVHSNSTIEHVGDYDRMAAFARNVQRLGSRYFVQTPNYWFPYEPHFRFPGFQYLPERVRVEMIRRFSLGFFHKVPDYAEALDIIQHHRLISARQMAKFFPDAEIAMEKVAGLNKSIMAFRG